MDQFYIGLDMVNLNLEKADFLKEIVPQLLEIAKEREGTYLQYDQSKKVGYSANLN